jgi:hypothetical protein
MLCTTTTISERKFAMPMPPYIFSLNILSLSKNSLQALRTTVKVAFFGLIDVLLEIL